MMDEIYDRTHRAGRDQLHSDIDRAVSKIGDAVVTTFTTMRSIQFAAPWKKRAKEIGCA